jgi:hypothetical protein
MAKIKVSQYDSIAANNTDINSINIAEGMAPSDVNNAIRELMAELKNFLAGTSGDTLPITAGGTGQITSDAALIALGSKTSATGSAILPTGTTAQRDGSPLFGYLRGNSTLIAIEWWNGTAWTSAGGYTGVITASGLTQATNRLLGRTTAATGAIEELSVGSKLLLSAGVLDSAVHQIQSVTCTQAGGALTFGLAAYNNYSC